MLQFVDNIYVIALFKEMIDTPKKGGKVSKTRSMIIAILKQNVEDPVLSGNLFDLTSTIEDGNIVSKTYQTSLNIYQYICTISAHPPLMVKGVVFSMLNIYYCQNSHLKDIWDIAILLYKSHKDQGWDRITLEPLFYLVAQ